MPIPFPHTGYLEDAQRRVRVLFGGQYVVDTREARLVWENAYYPSYFFNPDALPEKYLDNPTKGTTSTTYDLVVGGRTAKDAVILHTDGNLKDLIKIKFDKMDAWLEEDEEIYIHPRDPYKRIDIRQSSRQVRIELDGVVLANTNKPRLLYETGLIVRTYIPMGDVRLECLSKSELTTGCPYKGFANYFDANLSSGKKKDIAWSYLTAFPEATGVRGFIAFLDEKVDVFVDGKLVDRPKTGKA